MEEVKLTELNLDYFKNFKGTFSVVNKCSLEGENYAYKCFSDKEYFHKKINKAKTLSKAQIDSCILPKYLVYDDVNYNDYTGYLTDYIEGKKIDTLRNSENKVFVLNYLKEKIINMHNLGMIHGDLHFGNVFINSEENNAKIIDFDNCNYKKYKFNIKDASDYATLYVEKFGINNGLDVYLFNLMTFCILNKTYYLKTRMNIANKEYGVFGSDEESINLCNSLLLDEKNYNSDYLIDVYQKSLKKEEKKDIRRI